MVINDLTVSGITMADDAYGAIGQLDVSSSSSAGPNAPYDDRKLEDHLLVINRGAFNDNVATMGIVYSYEDLIVNDSEFKGNHKIQDSDGGAAISLGGHAKLTVNNSNFSENISENMGGAIATLPAGLRPGNTNVYGGTWVEIYNSSFTKNEAHIIGNSGRFEGNGGAIWLGALGTEWDREQDQVVLHKNVIHNSSFVGNIAYNNGGAIHNESRLVISGNTEFSGNTAKGSCGGAIYQLGNSLELNAAENETISFVGNTAAGKANDIYLADVNNLASNDQLYFDVTISGGEGNLSTQRSPELLLSGNGTIQLSGGIAGDESAEVFSHAANVTVADISGLKGTLNVEAGQFTLTNGVVNGNVNVTGGVFNAAKGITFAENTTGKVTLNGGTIATTLASVFTDTTLNNGFTLTSGTLNFGADKLSTTWLSKVSSSYSNVIFASSNIVDEDNKVITSVTSDQLQSGLIYSGATLSSTDSEIAVSTANTGVQTIASTQAVKTVSLGNNFTLIGDGQKLIQNEAEAGAAITAAGNIHLGLQGAAGGGELKGSVTTTSGNVFVDASDFTVGSVTSSGAIAVAQGASLTTDALQFGAASTINGALYAGSIDSTAALTVAKDAFVSFDTTDAQVILQSGSVVAIGQYQPDVAAVLPVANSIALFSVETPADGQVNSLIDASAADTLVTVGGGSEAAFQNALANAGVEYDAEQNAGIYFADTLKLDSNGKVQIGALTQPVAEGEVAVGAAGIVVIDSHRFMNTADYVIDGAARFASAAQIVLDGLNSTGDIKLSKTWNSTGTNVTFVDGNAFFNETLTANVDSDPSAVINVATNEAAFAGDAETYKLVDSMLAPTADEGIRNVVTAIGREDGAFINAEGKLTDDGFRALDETFAMPVTAGTYNVAYDAAEQVTGTVQRRNLEPSTGLGVWADVFYSTNEAKSIYGGQGYSADIYGGTIGFDGTFSCGAKLGLALSVGSGDADSEKSVGKYSNDADFYGVTVYTGKDIAGLYFSADASYLWLDNDISGQVAGASVKDSIDSNVFTVGVRADMTVYDQAFKVVPHVGMRYTNIDVDNYRGIESDSMNVFEMPIGVKVAGDFEPAAGWKLTPSFDFTVVPQVGDKNVSTLVGDIDVLDNLYNSTLGVNATYGNFAFGLSYRYGFGNDDRSNNAFQARASYQF